MCVVFIFERPAGRITTKKKKKKRKKRVVEKEKKKRRDTKNYDGVA